MNITLTREEAHGLLAALEELNRLSIGKDAICLPAEIDDAMEILEARLSAPEREWQGLTDEEAIDIEQWSPDVRWAIIRTGAKLKEKNT